MNMPEIIRNIMNYLPPSDLARLSRVNKNWYQASLHHPKWVAYAAQLKTKIVLPCKKEHTYDDYSDDSWDDFSDDDFAREQQKTPVKLDRSFFFQSLSSGRYCIECLTQYNGYCFRCISPTGTYTTGLICNKCYQKNHPTESSFITPTLVSTLIANIKQQIKVQNT